MKKQIATIFLVLGLFLYGDYTPEQQQIAGKYSFMFATPVWVEVVPNLPGTVGEYTLWQNGYEQIQVEKYLPEVGFPTFEIVMLHEVYHLLYHRFDGGFSTEKQANDFAAEMINWRNNLK